MFSCRFITLSQLFLQDFAFSIHLPGRDGDFEVFQGHTPLIEILRPGAVKLAKQLHYEHMLYLFITGGVFVFDGNEGTIFTSRAIFLADEREETLAQALEHFTYHELGESPLRI